MVVDQLFVEQCDNFKTFGEFLGYFPKLSSIYAVNNSLINLNGMLSIKDTLIHLNLSQNYIKNAEIVYSCTHLRYLNLSHNQIRFFSPYSEKSINTSKSQEKTSCLKELEYLNLCNNKIHTLDLSNCVSLKFLDVQNNLLQGFECGNTLPHIVYLNVQANGLRDLSALFKLKESSQLRFLLIANNLFGSSLDIIEQKFLDAGFDIKQRTELCLQFIPYDTDIAAHIVSKELGLYRYEPINKKMLNNELLNNIQMQNIDAPEVNVEDVAIAPVCSYDDEAAETLSQCEECYSADQSNIYYQNVAHQSAFLPVSGGPGPSQLLPSSRISNSITCNSSFQNDAIINSCTPSEQHSCESRQTDVSSKETEKEVKITHNFISQRQLLEMKKRLKEQCEVNEKQRSMISKLNDEISELKRQLCEEQRKTEIATVQKLKDDVERFKQKLINSERNFTNFQLEIQQKEMENVTNRCNTSSQTKEIKVVNQETQTEESFASQLQIQKEANFIETQQKLELENKRRCEQQNKLIELIKSVESGMEDLKIDKGNKQDIPIEKLLIKSYSQSRTPNDESAIELEKEGELTRENQQLSLFNDQTMFKNALSDQAKRDIYSENIQSCFETDQL